MTKERFIAKQRGRLAKEPGVPLTQAEYDERYEAVFDKDAGWQSVPKETTNTKDTTDADRI